MLLVRLIGDRSISTTLPKMGRWLNEVQLEPAPTDEPLFITVRYPKQIMVWGCLYPHTDGEKKDV